MDYIIEGMKMSISEATLGFTAWSFINDLIHE